MCHDDRQHEYSKLQYSQFHHSKLDNLEWEAVRTHVQLPQFYLDAFQHLVKSRHVQQDLVELCHLQCPINHLRYYELGNHDIQLNANTVKLHCFQTDN